MATSSCGKCGSQTFECKDVTPKHSNFVLTFVQCASCGAVVGAMDAMNLGAELAEVKNLLQKIQNALP